MQTFEFEGKIIQAEDDDTVLSALLGQEIHVNNRCRAGSCQTCLLRTGGVVPPAAQAGLADDLLERGAFLSCQAMASQIESAERLDSHAIPQFEATLIAKNWASDDVLLLTLDAPGWVAQAGRFIHLEHSSGVSRPYSLATPSWISDCHICLHVRVIQGGAMSPLLASAELGDAFKVQGPLGRCCYKSADGKEPLVLIGSGTGLAPLYGIASEALAKDHLGSVRLYHGAATSDGLYFRDELADLARQYEQFEYNPCADDATDSRDRVGSPLAAALSDRSDLSGCKVFLCGNPGLVKAGRKQCFLAGAHLRDIAADAFLNSE